MGTSVTLYAYFSSAHVIFTKIDYIPGHEKKTNKYEKIKIIQSILSDHNGIRLEMKNRLQESLQTLGN